jgi:D-glycerate 3-kinase
MILPIEPEHRVIAQRIAERAHNSRFRDTCLVVGLCGAQGSGKSTLAATLRGLLPEHGLAVATLSLDDFYLPLAAREELARTVHPLLKTRGVPGTHDVALALRVLDALRGEARVALPAFDKALDDRRPASEWAQVQAPVQVTVLEGWCVGAVPQPQAALVKPVNALEREEDPDGTWRRYVNDALARTYAPLFRQLGFLILLAAPGFDIVYRWRLEQEQELRRRVAAQGGDVSRLMSDAQLRRFISHYERLTCHILEEMPARADLIVRLGPERQMTILPAA